MLKKAITIFFVLCVAVVVSAQSKVVNIACGGLEEALSGDYSFTTLTVKGSMDVRDFAALGRSVALLEKLDLSGCSIEGYDSRDKQYMGNHSHFEADAIPPSAFLGFIALKEVVLSSEIEAIGDGAFAGCESLVSLSGCSRVCKIGHYAFSGCKSLQKVDLPSTLQQIGDYAFDKCAAIKQIDLAQCRELGYLGVRAFAQNSSLESVVLPDGLTQIQNALFAGCIALKSVSLPRKLDYCGEGVFAACTALQTIDMSECEMYELPAWTFSGCSLLSQVSLPPSITIIAEGAFSYCTSLKNIVLPAGISQLDGFAFAGCSALSQIAFMQEGIENIGRYAFYNNRAASRVKIPTTVSYIDDHAFDGCINANKFYTSRDVPAELGEMVFANMEQENKVLYVETASMTIYQGTAQWQDFGEINSLASVDDEVVPCGVCATFEQYDLRITSAQEIASVRLYDTTGVLLASVQPYKCETIIDTHSFVGNIYIVQVATNNGEQTVLKVARLIR